MAERSTWPETHLNAVNKLLCWDCSFLGKATRGHQPHPNLPCSPSRCPMGKTSGVGSKKKKSSSFGYCGRRRKGSVSLREPLGNPQVGAITKLWSTPSLAYHQSTRELKKKTCDTDADVPAMGGQRHERESKFHCRESVQRQRDQR